MCGPSTTRSGRSHKPGDEWGCQCGWEATDDPVTDNSGLGGERIEPSPGLKGNPARTAQLFSDDHPYFPSDCSKCAFKGVQLTLFTNRTKDCYHCKNVLKAVQKAEKTLTTKRRNSPRRNPTRRPASVGCRCRRRPYIQARN